MRRSTGLRVQLLVGLALIILVATVSIGAITVWTTRQQISEIELENGRLLGQSLSVVLSGSMGEADEQRRTAALQRVVAQVAVAPSIRSAVVVDRRLQTLVRSSAGAELAPHTADLAAAINSEQQVVRSGLGAVKTLAVSTPIYSGGVLAGGVRLELLLGPDRFGWPLLFWVLMALDGGAMVLFVGLVLTRYVIRPVEGMQRAAARVTRGDLSVRLPEEGARELSSLSVSFNAMTASVQEQLARLERQAEELAASRDALIRSEKLASVGRLAAGVAHEVGNPLQSIVGFTELLLDEPMDGEQRADFLCRVRDEAARIHRIVRELLDYARREAEALEGVELGAIVEQTVLLLGPQKRLREVTVQRQGLEELPLAAANGSRMVQVLLNILLNAADAMEGEGTVTVSGRALPDAAGVQLAISNSGPPIPEEDRARIFDPFFSTKGPGKGTGLGLSVAQAIVESYHGTLTLEPGEPTTFTIQLPRWGDQVQQRRPPAT